MAKVENPPSTSVVISLPTDQFIHDPAYHRLRREVCCPTCARRCDLEGYSDGAFIYRCPLCDMLTHDVLGIEPIFAADPLEAATLQHYAINCPYCGKHAPLVGGNWREGLFFVCEDRCHVRFARTIRRY